MSGQNNAGNNAPPANQQPPPPGVQQQGLQQPQGVQQGVQQPPPPGVQQFLPPPLFPGQLGAGQQLQGSVHSALWNSHYAFSSARWAESQALSATQSCAALAKSMVKNERWARDLKISQEQSKFKSPGDRKAISYLLEEQFDLKELYDTLASITPANNSAPVVTATNVQQIEKTLGATVSFLQKRIRLRKVEEESYRVARDSTFGWKTEKLFRRDDTFRSESYDDDLQPWEVPEMSDEKKRERLRSADREIKFQMSNARRSDENHSSVGFSPYARQGQSQDAGRKCFICGSGTHLSRTCFNRGRPHYNPSVPSQVYQQPPPQHGPYQPRQQQQQLPAQQQQGNGQRN